MGLKDEKAKEEVKAIKVEETKVEEVLTNTPDLQGENGIGEGKPVENVIESIETEKEGFIFKFDELEKAEDLGELLKDENNIRKNSIGYVVGDKYLLTEEELIYFTQVVFKLK